MDNLNYSSFHNHIFCFDFIQNFVTTFNFTVAKIPRHGSVTLLRSELIPVYS